MHHSYLTEFHDHTSFTLLATHQDISVGWRLAPLEAAPIRKRGSTVKVCPLQLLFQIRLQGYSVVVLYVVGTIEQCHIVTLSSLQYGLPRLRLMIEFGGIAAPELIPFHRIVPEP